MAKQGESWVLRYAILYYFSLVHVLLVYVIQLIHDILWVLQGSIIQAIKGKSNATQLQMLKDPQVVLTT
jgi:hypothetical protein